jgi:hypothetical protein
MKKVFSYFSTSRKLCILGFVMIWLTAIIAHLNFNMAYTIAGMCTSLALFACAACTLKF